MTFHFTASRAAKLAAHLGVIVNRFVIAGRLLLFANDTPWKSYNQIRKMLTMQKTKTKNNLNLNVSGFTDDLTEGRSR